MSLNFDSFGMNHFLSEEEILNSFYREDNFYSEPLLNLDELEEAYIPDLDSNPITYLSNCCITKIAASNVKIDSIYLKRFSVSAQKMLDINLNRSPVYLRTIPYIYTLSIKLGSLQPHKSIFQNLTVKPVRLNKDKHPIFEFIPRSLISSQLEVENQKNSYHLSYKFYFLKNISGVKQPEKDFNITLKVLDGQTPIYEVELPPIQLIKKEKRKESYQVTKQKEEINKKFAKPSQELFLKHKQKIEKRKQKKLSMDHSAVIYLSHLSPRSADFEYAQQFFKSIQNKENRQNLM